MLANKWNRRFLDLAKEIAKWSKDPESRVGAVLVSPNRIKMYHGYNGYPKHVDDDSHRDEKLDYTLHAEVNALLKAEESVEGWTLYVTKPPCLHCCLMAIQKGVNIVIEASSIDLSSKWIASQRKGNNLYAGIKNLTYTTLENTDE